MFVCTLFCLLVTMLAEWVEHNIHDGTIEHLVETTTTYTSNEQSGWLSPWLSLVD